MRSPYHFLIRRQKILIWLQKWNLDDHFRLKDIQTSHLYRVSHMEMMNFKKSYCVFFFVLIHSSLDFNAWNMCKFWWDKKSHSTYLFKICYIHMGHPVLPTFIPWRKEVGKPLYTIRGSIILACKKILCTLLEDP